MVKRIMILFGLVVVAALLANAPQSRQQATTSAPRLPQKLTPVEECANQQLFIDRSLSVGQAFRICEMPPDKQAETWLATRSNRK